MPRRAAVRRGARASTDGAASAAGARAAVPTEDALWRSIAESAAGLWHGVDGHARRHARAKLLGDRVFRHLLRSGLVAPGEHVLDLGCGPGLLAGLLRAADAANAGQRWPAGWAAAPTGTHVTGIDPLGHDIDRARTALGTGATFVQGDMRSAPLPRCDVACCIDTLHYLAHGEQDAVLARLRAALRPGGRVLLRVHDASARGRYAFGLWADRVTMLLHGGGFGRLHGRSPAGWRSALERLGFAVESAPMNGRPPFANLLFVGRLSGSGADPAT